MKSGIYVGSVTHQRFLPRRHRFTYPLFMWFLDLDRLHELPDMGRWFSTERFALSRYHRSDYLGEPTEPLSASVKNLLREQTGQPVTGSVFGLMNVRTLGLYFSPVNFYFGYNDGCTHCTHLLAEVSNIPWSEHHCYTHYIGDGNYTPSHPKEFHVSPFNPDRQKYSWQITPPDATLGIKIGVDDERGHIFDAELSLAKQPFTRRAIKRQLLRRPILTASVVGGIYWQALKLYLKGVPYVPYQKEPT